MSSPTWTWPNHKRIAVIFNVCLEGWSDGKAPGINPMGNPLPAGAGVIDSMAVSWAGYGPRHGVHRLLETFEKAGAKASVMVNGVIAERTPEAIKAVAAGGHEVLSHSYAMDVIPVLLSEEQELANIERCTQLLSDAAGCPIKGWLSPRGTASPNTARLLARAGYVWYGDALDDDLPYAQQFGARRIVVIPLGTDVNDMPSMKFGNPPESMLRSFMQNLDLARENGSVCIIDVTCHAHIFGRPRGAGFYAEIVKAAAASSDVWVATRLDIAEHVLAQG